MKNVIIILSFSLFIASCKESKNNNAITEAVSESIQEIKTDVTIKSSSNGTYLCKINGRDWSYTKASGIVSTHAKTGKRTAIITFTKKLAKGSESVQLTYDGDSFQLESATVQIRLPKKNGGHVYGIYGLHADTRDRNPNSDMSGILDLSNASTASGHAELVKFNIKYEEDLLESPKDAEISVSDLKFSGVGYSDIDKLLK